MRPEIVNSNLETLCTQFKDEQSWDFTQIQSPQPQNKSLNAQTDKTWQCSKCIKAVTGWGSLCGQQPFPTLALSVVTNRNLCSHRAIRSALDVVPVFIAE